MRAGFWQLLLITLITIQNFQIHAQSVVEPYIPIPDSCWADSVLQSLTLQEKIGQLIFARANKDNVMLPEIPELIRKYDIGGVVFFKGSPFKEVQATNAWQELAKTPLFVTIDAERGLAMRLDSTYGFPYMMTLGACDNDSLVYEVSSEIARGCKRMGIQVNFGPVVDINSNPRNPVINSRSFGEDKEKVSRKSLMYMKGLQDHGILHTAKHFPGHGDTDSDSHFTLPIVKHSYNYLDSVDLYPYKYLINNGLEGIMVAHIFVPSLDSAKNAAASLSKKTINKLLRKKLHFNGLIFTDALEMKGVTNYYQPGDIEVRAFLAGNDVLLMPQDVHKAIVKMKQAVDSCWIWPEDLDERCLKVLKYKHKYIPGRVKPISTTNLVKDLNPESNDLLYRRIMKSAFTLVRNNKNIIPLKRPDTLMLASVSIGHSTITSFQDGLEHYAPIDNYFLGSNAGMATIDTLLLRLKKYNLVIVSFVNTSIYSDKNFGITSAGYQFLACLQEQNKIILTFFGNPYVLGKLESLPQPEATLIAYQDNEEAYQLAAQALFGAIPIVGHLPVTATTVYPVDYGIKTNSLGRLQYCLPEECGISSDSLHSVDSLIIYGINSGAYPGCQVVAAWKGRVFYNKAFGKPSSQDSTGVKTTDLYDLASVTKVAATTLAIMKLYDEGKINLEAKLSDYLPYLKNTNKKGLIIRDILTHQARLKPWIPFFNPFIKNGKPDSNVIRSVKDSVFSISIADKMFMNKVYLDTLRKAIIDSPLEKKQEYKYSDLGFYLMRELVETITRMKLDEYVDLNFYRPLGLATMTYRPLSKFPLARIMPTEMDTVFRHQLIRGYVHDPGAAMLGGVSGHAGLFSDANDLAIILQMLNNGGVYGGTRYLKAETIKEFTSVQFPELENRRGLGFDKPLLHYADNGPSCESASASSFGHSGFTGTYIWADPDKDLLFVFLSNRVNPNAANHKLSDMNIRTRVHEMFYQAIKHAKTPERP